MGKKFQLSIPEPCHEDWDKMHPSGKGRFCDSCQKQVIDFSTMSDSEIAQFFKNPSTGSLCGRFMTDQLERTIEMPKKRIPWVKYFFQIALPAFLTTAKASAQGQVRMDMVKEKVQQEPDKVDYAKPLTGDTIVFQDKKKIKITGQVIDDRGDTLPFSVVRIKRTGLGTKADELGRFEIMANNGDVLQIMATGNIAKEIVVGDKKYAKNGNGADSENIGTIVLETAIQGGISFAPPPKIKVRINGKVVDEKGNPVPFATVYIPDLDRTIMADEQGLFAVNPKKKWYKMTLDVSSAGFKTETAFVKAYDAKADTIYIELEANDILPEVKVVAYPSVSRKSYMLGGAVTGIRVQTSFIDTIKNFFTKKMMPSVYPNPVGAGASLNIAVGQQEEGMYVFDLITANGQSVQKRELWIDKDARVLNFEVPAVSAGVYFLRMQHKQTGKATTEKIVVK